jgi:mannose-6-phosphate isomerase-like protein (cupin superfamily)
MKLQPGTAASATVLAAGEGLDVSRPGRELVIMATADQTHDRFVLLEAEIPAHVAGPPIHRHLDSEEAFYVLSGSLTVRLGDTIQTVERGAFVLVPRGLAHGFVTHGDEPARFLTLISPPGFERFELEVAELLRSSSEPDTDAMAAIARRYGWQMAGPPMTAD